MNVLYLTNNPNLGSTARILQDWLRLGAARGVHGVVVAPSFGPLTEWMEKEGYPHLVDPMPWFDIRDSIRFIYHALRVAIFAKRHRVSLIHCNEHNVYPFANYLRRLLMIPVVCHVRFKVSRDYCEWAFARTRRPDHLFWTSKTQQSDSADAVASLVPEDRQTLIYLGLDLASFGTRSHEREFIRAKWGVTDDDIVIGTASAFKPIKRLEDFIAIVGSLAREDSRIVGVVAGCESPGEASYARGILSQVNDLRLGNRLRMLGHLEPIEPFHHGIDVFVSTSEYETFGNSVCEAMACRRAVVAYQGGSVGEIVGDAGIVVETGDATRLQSAIRSLIADPSLRRDLGDRARDRVEMCFRPDDSHHRLCEIYENLVSIAKKLD